MKQSVYHGGKPGKRHQLVEDTSEAAVDTRNELGHMQWQPSMVKGQAAVCSVTVGISKVFCHNLKTSILL
jgi:hypothetical protein